MATKKNSKSGASPIPEWAVCFVEELVIANLTALEETARFLKQAVVQHKLNGDQLRTLTDLSDPDKVTGSMERITSGAIAARLHAIRVEADESTDEITASAQEYRKNNK